MLQRRRNRQHRRLQDHPGVRTRTKQEIQRRNGEMEFLQLLGVLKSIGR